WVSPRKRPSITKVRSSPAAPSSRSGPTGVTPRRGTSCAVSAPTTARPRTRPRPPPAPAPPCEAEPVTTRGASSQLAPRAATGEAIPPPGMNPRASPYLRARVADRQVQAPRPVVRQGEREQQAQPEQRPQQDQLHQPAALQPVHEEQHDQRRLREG